jgi:hypothetical protein
LSEELHDAVKTYSKLLEPAIDGGDLRIVVIVGQFGGMCIVLQRQAAVFGFPQPQMLASSSMKAIILISPWHFGHIRGSICFG